MVGKWKYPGYTGNQHGTGLIHHDQGKLNNSPDTLVLCADAAAHGLLHRDDLLKKRADPVFEAKRLAGLEAYNNAPENRKRAAERFAATMRRPDVHKKMQKVRAKTGKVTGPRNLTAYNKSEAHRQKTSEIGKRTIHKAIAARRRSDITIERVIELRQSGLTDPMIAGQLKCSVSLVSRRFSAARKRGIYVPPAPYHADRLSCAAPGNHKVVSVGPDGCADVYDISVEGTSNFALDAGVFVHNSKDVADAFAAVVYYLSKNWQHIGIGGVSMGVTAAAAGVPGEAIMTVDGNFRWPDEPPLPEEGGEDWSGLPTYII